MKKFENDKMMAENFRYFQFLYQSTHLKPYCEFPPHQFYVEPTNICNLRCKMCIQDKMSREKGYMDLSLMKKIIDEVSEFDPFFDFCRQGEPLIHPDIIEMVEYAIAKGLTKTRMITNGTLLRKKISEKLLKSGLHKLNISFNGYDKESYERIQKGAGFERSLEKIVNLLRKKLEYNLQVPEIEVSLVEYRDDVSENKNKFYEIFKKLPVNRIRVSGLINFYGSNKEINIDKNVERDYKEWPSCKVPFRFFNINWNGDVTPCIIDYDSKYIVGNVKDAPVLDIWNNHKMQEFRKFHIEKNFDAIKDNSKGKFCDYCSQLWYDPYVNGPQYPPSFEKGAEDFFKKNDKKTMAGTYSSDIFRTKEEVQDMKREFLRNYDKIYYAITEKK